MWGGLGGPGRGAGTRWLAAKRHLAPLQSPWGQRWRARRACRTVFVATGVHEVLTTGRRTSARAPGSAATTPAGPVARHAPHPDRPVLSPNLVRFTLSDRSLDTWSQAAGRQAAGRQQSSTVQKVLDHRLAACASRRRRRCRRRVPAAARAQIQSPSCSLSGRYCCDRYWKPNELSA